MLRSSSIIGVDGAHLEKASHMVMRRDKVRLDDALMAGSKSQDHVGRRLRRLSGVSGFLEYRTPNEYNLRLSHQAFRSQLRIFSQGISKEAAKKTLSDWSACLLHSVQSD